MKTPLALLAALLLGSVAAAEDAVTLSDMHLCCGACVKAVNAAVKSVDGVEVSVDKAGGSATLNGDDAKALQQAVDAIAAAGFHATSSSDKIAIKDDSGVKAGKTQRLALVGVHNCCGGCNVAIKKALKTVDGIVADTAKAKSDKLVVEGEFDALAVVQALNKAGFHVQAAK